jgi:hypothetical protein
VGRKGRKNACFLGQTRLIHSYPQVINIKKWDNIFPPYETLSGKGF